MLPADLASFSPEINGAAIEVRICAEDPSHNYRPCTGEGGYAKLSARKRSARPHGP
jgi:acetyl/propionyl-CoA carboxylase alpha subunit